MGSSTERQYLRMPSGIKRVLYAALLCLTSTSAWGGDIPEYKLKAAYLYNFASFTEWPVEFEDFELCVFGKDPFGSILKQIASRKINRRPITTRTVRTIEGVEGCQMIFVAPSASSHIQQIQKHIVGQPVLTVADSKGALDGGVMINMETQRGKVSFEVNLPVVKQHGLEISSKLLRLAKRVVR